MLRRLPCSLVLSLLCAVPAIAGTVAEHEQHVQAARDEVRAMAGKDADPAQLRQGVARLEASLRYLDDPAVAALALGDANFHERGYDVRMDLARLYARLGMNDQALATLDAAQRLAWVPQQSASLANDPAFAGLRDAPRFQRVLHDGAIAARLWKAPAGDVPYQETLTVEQRIAGLTAFWSEARAGFAYFDHVPDLDWNQTYLDFLPKVIAAQTTRDYYDVMMQLAPLLQDGHTNIWAPPELQDHFNRRPPMVTELVEGHVLVMRVDSRQLAQRVHVGDEITAVDGMPVRRYAEERVAPYVSSSTPQDRDLRMYTYQFLAGDAREPVTVTLRDRAGRQRQEVLARSGYPDVQAPASSPLRMLPGGVAYVALDQFETDAALKAFEAALPVILSAKALVLDVRRNGGGSTGYGWEVLSYLSATPIHSPPQFVRVVDPLTRARQSDVMRWKPVAGEDAFTHAHPQLFTGRVAVLTGPRTFSAGEDFVSAFNGLKRGVTVGAATGGSTGQPLMLKLPGGGSARICIKRDLAADGSEFVGFGLAPDIAVSQTVDAVRAGRDVVLERALLAVQEPVAVSRPAGRASSP